MRRLLPFGPAGCPPVAETCTGSLALAFRTSTQSAKGWITTRSPCDTASPASGNVSRPARCTPGRLARSPARRRTSVSSPPGSSTGFADQVELVAWTRFVEILDATLLQVDPTTYGERQAKAAAQRDVKATQSSDGLRTLVARGTSGDVTMFLALVDAIAQALADEGDEDPYPVRKSKAIGIAAYPDRAQDLLSRGRHREDPRDRGTRSTPTWATRPTRGPMIFRPQDGSPPGTATTTSPASTTNGRCPAPSPPTTPTSRTKTSSTLPIWPGTTNTRVRTHDLNRTSPARPTGWDG